MNKLENVYIEYFNDLKNKLNIDYDYLFKIMGNILSEINVRIKLTSYLIEIFHNTENQAIEMLNFIIPKKSLAEIIIENCQSIPDIDLKNINIIVTNLNKKYFLIDNTSDSEKINNLIIKDVKPIGNLEMMMNNQIFNTSKLINPKINNVIDVINNKYFDIITIDHSKYKEILHEINKISPYISKILVNEYSNQKNIFSNVLNVRRRDFKNFGKSDLISDLIEYSMKTRYHIRKMLEKYYEKIEFNEIFKISEDFNEMFVFEQSKILSNDIFRHLVLLNMKNQKVQFGFLAKTYSEIFRVFVDYHYRFVYSALGYISQVSKNENISRVCFDKMLKDARYFNNYPIIINKENAESVN